MDEIGKPRSDQRTHGLFALLSSAPVYDWFQDVLGADRLREDRFSRADVSDPGFLPSEGGFDLVMTRRIVLTQVLERR